MYSLVCSYATDLKHITFRGKPLCDLSLPEIYKFVKSIPYKRDIAPVETISRPVRSISAIPLSGGLDCKKKAILIGAWALCNGIPFQFVASSNSKTKRVHHVYPQLKLSGTWKTADATYSHYILFRDNPKETYREILLPSKMEPENMGFVGEAISAAAGVVGQLGQRRQNLSDSALLSQQATAEQLAYYQQRKLMQPPKKSNTDTYLKYLAVPLTVLVIKKLINKKGAKK